MDSLKLIGDVEPCTSRDLFREIPLCRDPEKLLLQLQEKVERIEKNADDLYGVLEYLTRDEDIITQFAKVEPFPVQTVKGALRYLVWTLEEKIRDLEGIKDEDSDIPQTRSVFEPMVHVPESPIPTSQTSNFLADDSDKDLLGKSKIYAYPMIKTEIDEMINELSEWHQTNEEIIATLNQVRGLNRPANVLCDCLKDVNEMRNILNILTGGRYLKGLDISFLNPRLVTLIEKKLRDAKKFLRELVDLLRQLDIFLRQLRAIMIRFSPYLDKTPLLEYEEQPYIGLDKLYDALRVVEDDMMFIDEIISQLLVSAEERDERIAYMKTDIAWSHKVKLDKEEVEDILNEKADLSEMNDKINRNTFVKLINNIAGNLYTSTGELILQEALWCTIMDDMKNKLTKKASKSTLRELEDIVKSQIDGVAKKIEDIKSHLPQDQEKKALQYGHCISCGIDMPFQCNEEKRITKRRKIQLKATLLNVKSEFNKKKSTAKRLVKAGSCGDFLKKRKLYKYKRPYMTYDTCETSIRYCGGSHTIVPAEQRLNRKSGETEYYFEECVETKECLDKVPLQSRFVPPARYKHIPKKCYYTREDEPEEEEEEEEEEMEEEEEESKKADRKSKRKSRKKSERPSRHSRETKSKSKPERESEDPEAMIRKLLF